MLIIVYTFINQPVMKHIMEIAEDEPLMKKQKTEDSLEPEIQFMMKFNVNSSIYFFFFNSMIIY